MPPHPTRPQAPRGATLPVPRTRSRAIHGALMISALCLASTAAYTAVPPHSRLVNLSTRAVFTNPSDELLVGFVLAGEPPHPLLLRAVGPSLSLFNITRPLRDPDLRLLDGAGSRLAENEDWLASVDLIAASQATGAFALQPGSADAAMLRTLGAGNYVAQATSKGESGVVLVEAYDADASLTSRLVNLSTRGPAAAGEAQLIAGFVIAGTTPLPLLLRGVGPSLAEYGVQDALPDPILTLFDAQQRLISTNDDWAGDPALALAFDHAGAFGLDPASRDSAIAIALAPGNYSVQLSGKESGRGEALVEIYVLDSLPMPATDGEVVSLFNGRNLDGLYVWSQDHGYGDPTRIYTVVDGMLRVAGEENYAALTTLSDYENYVMTLEFKWGDETYGKRARGARDAGILLHCVGPQGGWRGRLQPAIEVQVLEGGMGDFILLKDTESPPGMYPMTITSLARQVRCRYNTWNCRGGYIWDPAGDPLTLNEAAQSVHALGWDRNWQDELGYRRPGEIERPTGEWNQFVIVAQGDRIEVYFNGVKVNEAINVHPRRGRIGLEAELAEYFVRRWDLRPIGL